MFRTTVGVLLLVGLSGCGGGSSGVTNNIVPTNQSPTANAGADQVVAEGGNASLDGSTSTDPDGTIASYLWTQIGGTPAVNLVNDNQAMASFTAPAVTADITLTFQIQVTDNAGLSATDTVVVTVSNVPNQAPTANAGTDQSLVEGSTVTLNAAASSDTDGTIASYLWTQTAGLPMVTLTNADQSLATFTAPDVTMTSALTFDVTITDDEGAQQRTAL